MDELVKQGEVVRVGEDTYAYVEKAFAGLDLAAVVSAAAQLVENEPRIIEGEQLRNHLNRALGLDHNKVFYLSLLRLHAPRQGRRWHYTHNLISRSPIGFESLRDLCRSLRPRSGHREEWASRIQRRCLISQERLKHRAGCPAGERAPANLRRGQHTAPRRFPGYRRRRHQNRAEVFLQRWRQTKSGANATHSEVPQCHACVA